MPYTQSARSLRVTTPLGPDALLLVALSGTEGISQLFSFQMDCVAENSTDVPFEKLLGQKVIAELGEPGGSVRYISGIAVRASQGERDATFTAYRLEVVPQFWLLTRISQSRIFQQLPVSEILSQVLKGFDVKFDLRGHYEPRDYCVQYRESDFNFASRLMEEEGVFYYFDHSAGGHVLVITDSPPTHPAIPGKTAVPYDNVEGGTRKENRVNEWAKVQELRSAKYTLWDHSFELPHKHLEAEKLIQDSVAAGQVTHRLKLPGTEKLEIYDFPGEYAQRFDGVNPGGGERAADPQKIFQDNKRTVEIRMQQEAVSAMRIFGGSNLPMLIPGHRFTLQGHFNADGEYLVVTTEHSASQDALRSEQELFKYSNKFTCIPSALPFRPLRVTSRPVVQGSQTAVVVGPPGEEIFTDKYGRVKVQFHWDRQGKNNASSSCWIRVGTLWSGKQWGVIHLPRVGQEVIVDFIEGDPDDPIIIGSVYNAETMPPYTLPDNRTQSGVKSRSSLGGGADNFNEIRFEDKKGEEQVFIHAEKNQDIEVENDETHSVGHDRKKTVDHDETTQVKNDRTETVGNNETITVLGNRTEKVMRNEDITVLGKRTETVAQNETITVAASRSTTVGVGDTLTVGGSHSTTAGASDSTTAGASISELAGASVSITAGGAVTITAATITLTAAAITLASPAVTISGRFVKPVFPPIIP